MLKKIFSYKNPQNLIVLMNILTLILLFFYKDQHDRLLLVSGILLMFIIYVSNYVLLKTSSGDHYIFLIMGMLISIGILMIYRINPKVGFKQVIWFGISMVAYFSSYVMVKKVGKWKEWTKYYAAIALALFLLTLVLGTKIKGATNWIRIGNHSFQPAEMIKLVFIFFLASYYANKEKLFNKYIFLGIVYGHMIFLFIQRDLGTAMLFFLVFITIFYIYEEDRKLIYYNLLGAGATAFFSFLAVNHVSVRVETWIDPWRFIDTKGYQITQSLFAIGTGGFFGTGVGLGHPEFIPEVHTDFIFSAICEEMGIFGGIAVIMLFLIIVYRGFKIALNQQDQFFRILALGITAMLGFQAFIIIGGVMKVIPLTGVTLPFVSYGGSSLLSSFSALGILQVASEEIETEQEEAHEHRIQEDH